MTTTSDKLLSLGAGYGLFILLFIGYEYYLQKYLSFIPEYQEIDFTWQALGVVLIVLVVSIPAVMIGLLNKSQFLLYGLMFAFLVSITAYFLDTQAFGYIFGSDILFAVGMVVSDYFLVAVLGVGFGEAIAKSR